MKMWQTLSERGLCWPAKVLRALRANPLSRFPGIQKDFLGWHVEQSGLMALHSSSCLHSLRAEFGLLMSNELPPLQELQGLMLLLYIFFFFLFFFFFFFKFPRAPWEILSCSLFPSKPWVALNSRGNCTGELQRFEGIKLESLWLQVQAPTGILSGAARREVAGCCCSRKPCSRDNLNVPLPSTASEGSKSTTAS